MIPRVLPISPGDGRALAAWLAHMPGPCLLREPGRLVARWAPGHIVHARCADAPIPGCGLHLPSGTALPEWPDLLGVSCHSEAEVLAARGADYVLLSPMFRPTSKPDDTRPTLVLEDVLALQERTDAKILVLGGITPERAHRLLDAGVYGVAVLGVLAENPERIREYPC